MPATLPDLRSTQMATMNTIASMGFLNVGTMMALNSTTAAAGAAGGAAGNGALEGAAAVCLGLSVVFGLLTFRGMKRVQRLDKFEKEIKG